MNISETKYGRITKVFTDQSLTDGAAATESGWIPIITEYDIQIVNGYWPVGAGIVKAYYKTASEESDVFATPDEGLVIFEGNRVAICGKEGGFERPLMILGNVFIKFYLTVLEASVTGFYMNFVETGKRS